MAKPEWWRKPRAVTVCVDTPGWFDAYAEQLVRQAGEEDDNAFFTRNSGEVGDGGIAFFLSCLKITPPDVLQRNHHNIVVHASALPKGRGFSPLVWQVLEGASLIPISMIFAADEVDAGDVVMADEIELQGNELNDEMRHMLGSKIVEMCLKFLRMPEPPVGEPQTGAPSWYRRRRPEDSRLDPERTLAEQFDLLRVVDNSRYPAFFDFRGRRYVLKIEALDEPCPVAESK